MRTRKIPARDSMVYEVAHSKGDEYVGFFVEWHGKNIHADSLTRSETRRLRDALTAALDEAEKEMKK